MRFNIIIAVSLLCTLVSGFTTSSRLSRREADLVKVREFIDLADEIVELAARGKIKKTYTVPAGARGGIRKPGREYLAIQHLMVC
jgi:hypothetical protein